MSALTSPPVDGDAFFWGGAGGTFYLCLAMFISLRPTVSYLYCIHNRTNIHILKIAKYTPRLQTNQ